MKWSRRTVLLSIAVLAAGCDMIFFGVRWHNSAQVFAVTYAGIDSLSIIAPASQKPAALQSRQWAPRLADAQISTTDAGGAKRELSYITLEPRPTYAHFLAAVRDLKTRGKCNIAVREGGRPIQKESIAGERPAHDLDIPALFLCGHSIGDAGFYGILPPDGIVRLDANFVTSNGS